MTQVKSENKKNTISTNQEMMKSWRSRIFFTVWFTYMIYYIGRVNFGIVKPEMIAEYGISTTTFGTIGSAFFYAYAFGQFVNGAIGDKFGARKIVAFGLIVSSLINFIIGAFGQYIWLLGIFWGLNGFFQSMGWAPSVKTIANWFPPEERGKWSSRLGTSYMIGGTLAWVLAIFLINTLGLSWRYAFIFPGIIMLIAGIHYYLRVRNAPEEVGLPTIEEENEGKENGGEVRNDHHLGFEYTIGSILKNKTVWFAAFGLFCLNMIRYGITEWLPLLIATESSNQLTIWKSIAFPIGGALGALSCAKISDKYLKKRRMPIISVLFILLGISLYIYSKLPQVNIIIGIPLLLLIGFLTFGPHVLLVSTIPMEFATRKAASSATGFIDGWGYIGAAISTQIVGIILDKSTIEYAFIYWILAAFLAGLVLVANWNGKPKKKEYF